MTKFFVAFSVTVAVLAMGFMAFQAVQPVFRRIAEILATLPQ